MQLERPHPEDAAVLLATTLPPRLESKAADVFRVGKYTFRADFDSANLGSVEQGGAANEFFLHTRRDCGGTANEKATRTWFYFSVCGHAPGDLVMMTIMNLNKQSRLYSQDYRPWCWCASQGEWQPLKLKVTYRREGDDFQLRFCQRFDNDEETLFAFAIPFSYQQTQDMLDHLDAQLREYGTVPPQAELSAAADPLLTPGPPTRYTSRTHSPGLAASAAAAAGAGRRPPAASIGRGAASGAPPAASAARRNSGVSSDTGTSASTSYTSDAGPSRLYYRRQLLTRTLDGRRVEVVTISDCYGAAGTGGGELEPPLPGVFEHDPGPPAAAFSPEHKKVFFVSSRVHPGETPATHMFNGMLAFLLRRTDPRAAALRRRFVFKLVPLVNPDGVAVGNYRTDMLGQNLNRYYNGVPDEETQPAVYAIKTLLMHFAQQGLLEYYIDLHAHANKKGVFIYGNTLEDGEAHLASLMYAKLVALNNPVFDFVGCNFTEKNMSRADKDGASKEGAGRVALYRETGLTHLYTIEANYNTSTRLNVVAPASGDHAGRASPPCNRRFPPKFTPGVLQGVGRAFLVAALDLEGSNPWSRLPHCEHRSLEGVRSWISSVLRAAPETRAAHLPPMSDGAVDAMRGSVPSGAARTAAAAAALGSGGLARHRSSSMHTYDSPASSAGGGYSSASPSPGGFSGSAFGRRVSGSAGIAASAGPTARRFAGPSPSPSLPPRRANAPPPSLGAIASPVTPTNGGYGVMGRRVGLAGTHGAAGALARSSSLPVRSSTPLSARRSLQVPAQQSSYQHSPGESTTPVRAAGPSSSELGVSAMALVEVGSEEEAEAIESAGGVVVAGAETAAGGGGDGPSDSDGDDDDGDDGGGGAPLAAPPLPSPLQSPSSPSRPGSARFRGFDGGGGGGASLRASSSMLSYRSPVGYSSSSSAARVTEFKIPLADRSGAAATGADGAGGGGSVSGTVALDPTTTTTTRAAFMGGAAHRAGGGGGMSGRPLSAGAVGRPLSAGGAALMGIGAAGAVTASGSGGGAAAAAAAAVATMASAVKGAAAALIPSSGPGGMGAASAWRPAALTRPGVGMGGMVGYTDINGGGGGGGGPAAAPKGRSTLSFVRAPRR